MQMHACLLNASTSCNFIGDLFGKASEYQISKVWRLKIPVSEKLICISLIYVESEVWPNMDQEPLLLMVINLLY